MKFFQDDISDFPISASLVQIRQTNESLQSYENEFDSAVIECDKFKKDLEAEEKTLNGFLSCIATCEDPRRMQELAKESQFSASRMSSLKVEYLHQNSGSHFKAGK